MSAGVQAKGATMLAEDIERTTWWVILACLLIGAAIVWWLTRGGRK